MSAWARLFDAVKRRPFRSALAALAVFLTLLLAGILALLYSEPGRSVLARYIEGALSRPGTFEIELDRLQGALPATIRVDRIAVRDSAGVWMTVRGVELDWSPLELLDGRLRIDSARAGEIVMLRRPAAWEAPARSAEDRSGIALPSLEIALDGLTIDALGLEEPVLGQAANVKLAASASALRDRVTARLNVERVDGMPGHAGAMLDWNASTGSLDIDAVLSEPADGLVARLLNLPGRPPLDLSVAGDGPAADWRGRVALKAGSLLTLGSSLSISIGQDVRLAMQGEAAPGESLGPDVMAVLGPRTGFDLEVLHRAGRDDWGIIVRELTSMAIAARGNATIDTTTARIAGTVELETAESDRLARLAEPATFESAAAKAGFSGPLTHPVVQLEAHVDDLAVAGFAATRTNLRVELHPDGPLSAGDVRVSMDGEAKFDRLKTPSPELAALLGDEPRLSFAGARLDGYSRLNLGRTIVSGARADASLAGDLALDSGILEASGRIAISDLAPLSATAGRAVAGRLHSDVVMARDADGAIDLALDGMLEDATLEQPVAERLLGPSARFIGKIRRRPDGVLLFSDLALSGKGVDAKGQLTLRLGAGRLEAEYDIAVSDLGALGIADRERTGGTLGVTGTAAGPLADPAIEGRLHAAAAAPGGFPVERLDAQYTVSRLATAPRGEVRLNGETRLLPDLSGRTAFVLAGNRLTLSRLSLSARATSVDGTLAIPLGGEPVTGSLAVRSPDIGAWSDIAGRKLSGGLEGRVRLTGDAGRQDASLDLTLSNLAIDEQVSSRRITLDMRLADPLGEFRLRGSAAAGDLRSGSLQVGALTLDLDGPVRDLGYRLRASGQVRDRSLGFDARGRLRKTDDRTTLAVTGLTGTVADIPIELSKPALVEIAPALDSGDIALTVGAGTARGRYSQAGDKVSMRADAEAVPLASLWPAAPPQLDKSVIDTSVSLDGPLAGPTGRLELSVTGLAAGETEEIREGLTLAAQGELAGGRLSAAGRIEGLAGVTANMEMAIPARLSLAPADFAIDEGAPLRGRLVYRGPVEPGWVLMGLDRHRLEGQGDVAVDVSGTLGDPQVSGRVALADGRYENLDTGTILSEIQVSAHPSSASMIIDRAVATDGGEGEVSISGAVVFGGGEVLAMDLEADFRKARLVRRDELNAVASGRLALRGGASKRIVSGRLDIDEAEIRLVGGAPPGIVEIPVEEKGTPPPGAARPPARPRPSRTELDLAISMPKRVFVRGRGLDSEWGGELAVTGTTAAPRVQGELRPLRGRYDFAGNIFTLRQGSIAFAGKEEIDPMLDLSAERAATDLTAVIRVTGTAKKPVVAMESVPNYPQDEVLARVMFNKSTGRLTAGEALQLAQAVGTLTGATDGGGIMDFARGMLNLDVLRFEGKTEDSAGGAEAGKYLSDDIYVGVEGSAAGETGVTVEIEITPRLKLESDVGRKDKGQVGLKWKRDY